MFKNKGITSYFIMNSSAVKYLLMLFKSKFMKLSSVMFIQLMAKLAYEHVNVILVYITYSEMIKNKEFTRYFMNSNSGKYLLMLFKSMFMKLSCVMFVYPFNSQLDI